LNNKIVREEEELQSIKQDTTKETFTITYAGNIGEGQGLHKIIPQAAARLGNKYRFKVVGDGGVKGLLENELKQFNVSNVEHYHLIT
jgi:glycosyltransferase involved in cell wall biosynthesis